MKSLRTDDIIGAMPRVRHMPKNLLRQQRSYPYTHNNSQQYSPIKDYDTYHQSLGGKWDHSYNQNIYGNFPLSQYDPNPFIKQAPLNKSVYKQQVRIDSANNNKSMNYQYDNLDNHKHELINSNPYQEIHQNQTNQRPNQYKSHKYEEYMKNKYANQNQYDNKNQGRALQPHERQILLKQRQIKKKQALLINYQQLKQLQNEYKGQDNGYQQRSKYAQYEIRKSSRQPNSRRQSIRQNIRQNPQKIVDNSYQMAKLSEVTKKVRNNEQNKVSQLDKISESLNIRQRNINDANNNNRQIQIKKNSSNSMRRSQQKDNNKDRNIFRGLGFNIITNNRYSYNMQTSVPYTRRQN